MIILLKYLQKFDLQIIFLEKLLMVHQQFILFNYLNFHNGQLFEIFFLLPHEFFFVMLNLLVYDLLLMDIFFSHYVHLAKLYYHQHLPHSIYHLQLMLLIRMNHFSKLYCLFNYKLKMFFRLI